MTVLRELERRPISLRAANRFVIEHHRHNNEVRGWLFGTSLWLGDELRSVGIAGRPVGRGFDDGLTIEILRVCTLGDQNACSMLYGALCRAAKALGYQRAITYTLADEPGISPAAAGFVLDAELPERPSWASEARHRYDTDLFGTERRPTGPKHRWIRNLCTQVSCTHGEETQAADGRPAEAHASRAATARPVLRPRTDRGTGSRQLRSEGTAPVR